MALTINVRPASCRVEVTGEDYSSYIAVYTSRATTLRGIENAARRALRKRYGHDCGATLADVAIRVGNPDHGRSEWITAPDYVARLELLDGIARSWRDKIRRSANA